MVVGELELKCGRTPNAGGFKTYFHRAMPMADGNTELETIVAVSSFCRDEEEEKEEETKEEEPKPFDEPAVSLSSSKPPMVVRPLVRPLIAPSSIRGRQVTIQEISIPRQLKQPSGLTNNKNVMRGAKHVSTEITQDWVPRDGSVMNYLDPTEGVDTSVAPTKQEDEERKRAIQFEMNIGVQQEEDDDDISEKLNGKAVRHEVASVTSEPKDFFTQLIDAIIDMDGKPAFVDEDEMDKYTYCTSFTRDTFLTKATASTASVESLDEETRLRRFSTLATATIYIDEYQTWAFARVLGHLQANDEITDLTICRGNIADGHRSRTEEEMKQFLGVVGALKNLKKLAIWYFPKEDMKYLEPNLMNHPTLSCLQLQLATGTVKRPLLKAIASIPHLEELKIEVNASFPVALVMESKSLKSLRVVSKNFLFRDDHMLSVGSRLENNQAMTWLDIEPQMSQFAFRVLTYALRRNATLTHLFVSIVGSSQNSDKSLAELSETLKVNSTLDVVWNHSYHSLHVSNETKDDVLSLLEFRTISKFHIFDEDAFFWLKKKTAMERSKLEASWCLPCRFDLWMPCSDDQSAWIKEFQADQVF